MGAPQHGWRTAAAAALAVIALAHLTNLFLPFPMDFVSFWAAGKLALAGAPAAAWDFARHHAAEAAAVANATKLPFGYPPPFLLAVAPFALLPFAPAALAWTGATLAAYLFAGRRLMPGAVALAFPGTIVAGVIGQNGFLTAALLFAGVALLRARPWLAGALLGCLAIKPQLGPMVPLALLAGREWRAMAGAALAVLGLSLASLLAFGWPAWAGFLAALPLSQRIVAAGLVPWAKMASVYAAARALGLKAPWAAALQAAGALAGAVLLWREWRRHADPAPRAAALAIATALASPYLFAYDQVMLAAAIGWLLARRRSAWPATALCLVPLASLSQMIWHLGAVPLAPALPLLLLALGWRPLAGGGALAPATDTALLEQPRRSR